MERQAAREAIQQLDTLVSVTSAGVTYREYERRVLDAKIAVDRYLATHGTDDEAVVQPIARATSLYVFAVSIWSVSFDNAKVWKFVQDNRDQTRQVCPAAVDVWDSALSSVRYVDPSWGEALRESLLSVWVCAGQNLVEASKALALAAR